MRTIRATAAAMSLLVWGCEAPTPASEATAPPAVQQQPEAQPLAVGSIVAGAATAHDGDDLIINGVDVRLNGFDTPERGKQCGEVDVYARATQELASIVTGQEASCEVVDIDRHGRPVGRCSAGGADVGERMVSSGWARDWPRYSQRRYAEAEAAARAAGRGIWGLQCSPDPWSGRNYD